jgi:sarcosine oxidase
MSLPRSNTQQQCCKILIIGACGLVGSSAFYQAAKIEAERPSSTPSTALFTSSSVVAIDQFTPGHVQGSSHGESRITRLAIAEGKEYVDLAKRSHDIWKEIETRTNYKYGTLLNLTPAGGLIVGPSITPASYHGVENFAQQSALMAEEAKLSFDILKGDSLNRSFPQFKFPDDARGYTERTMGYINPDACIKSNLFLARQYRGELRCNEKVLSFEQLEGNKIKVITSKNGVEYQYLTDKLIIAAGPWLNNLIEQEELKVFRQVVYWFTVHSSAISNYTKEVFPTFIWSFDSEKMVYGFPIMKQGETTIKLGAESYATVTTPETVERRVSQQEINDFYDKVVRPNFLGITSECVKAEVCLYTVAPNSKFVVDFLPGYKDNVIVASPCSGHGAKHAAALGEAVAQQSLLGDSKIPVIKLFGGLLTKKEPLVSPRRQSVA